jgi:hypothetical protein
MTITDIVTKIERRLADAHAEVAHLEGARVALLNGSQAAPARKPRAARRKPAAANGARAQVLALLKEQETAGEVRRSGTRAATRWHVITDEDRIAARATELTAQSSRTRARTT